MRANTRLRIAFFTGNPPSDGCAAQMPGLTPLYSRWRAFDCPTTKSVARSVMNSSILRLATSEFVSEPHAKYPRPRDGLRRNELRARGEYALDHIAEVLGVQLRRPRILRDADRCVVLRERGIFKPQLRRAHVRTRGERGVTAGLGERMAGMRGAGLREGIVRVHRPLVPQTQVELQRRRIGGRAADGTVRILNAEDWLSVFGLARRVC